MTRERGVKLWWTHMEVEGQVADSPADYNIITSHTKSHYLQANHVVMEGQGGRTYDF